MNFFIDFFVNFWYDKLISIDFIEYNILSIISILLICYPVEFDGTCISELTVQFLHTVPATVLEHIIFELPVLHVLYLIQKESVLDLH